MNHYIIVDATAAADPVAVNAVRGERGGWRGIFFDDDVVVGIFIFGDAGVCIEVIGSPVFALGENRFYLHYARHLFLFLLLPFDDAVYKFLRSQFLTLLLLWLRLMRLRLR